MNWNVQSVTASAMKTYNTKVRGEPKTIVTADLKHIRYAIGMPLLQWQNGHCSNRFMRGSTVEYVLK